MCVPRRILFLCLFIAAAPAARAASPVDFSPFDPAKPLSDAERDQRIAALDPGLSPDQVRRLIGPPQHIARQILYHRCLEQWVYGQDFPVCVEFDCPRGQEPHLQSVRLLGPAGH
jgi:hypothetical protein